jgi:hypothetical protein
LQRISHIFITLILAISLVSPASTAAGTDLLVGPSHIRPSVPFVPGQSYTLPVHEITNNSFRALNMTVSVADKEDDQRELPPVEWFSIKPTELIVQAKSTEEVQVVVNVPSDAPPGQYKVWFLFDALPMGGDGLIIGAAINVSLEFEIRDMTQTRITAPSTGEEAKAKGIPWALIVLLLVAVPTAIAGLWHRRQRKERW